MCVKAHHKETKINVSAAAFKRLMVEGKNRVRCGKKQHKTAPGEPNHRALATRQFFASLQTSALLRIPVLTKGTMFSFFKSKKSKPAAPVEVPPAPAKRMTLEDRKAFRQEMLYQSIRESFLSMEVLANMYKFKVIPVDERHHRFVAMVDVAKSFVTGRDNRTQSFAAFEQLMRVNAYKRFGVLIDGIYWRVSESESQFERYSRVTDVAGAAPVQRGQSAPGTTTALARQTYQAVSDDEAKAFMDALHSGKSLPAVRVGEQEYQSDLAPLDGGIMIGGTQYGKL